MNNRNCFLYAILVLCVVALGLASRHFQGLPPFVHTYVGDVLWALMVFVGFGMLFPRQTTLRLGIYALCFAFFIEFSQLYHAPWIDAIRHNRIGGLVLGFGFLWSDLLAYTGGISFGMLAEYSLSGALQSGRKNKAWIML